MKKNVLFFLFLFVTGNSFSQAPAWLWAISASGGSCFETGVGISASTSGNLYVTGRFNGTISFGSDSASTDRVNIVSGKLNTSGTFSWLSSHAYTGYINYVYAFARDNTDYTYTTGKIGSDTGGIYIDKYNSSGTLSWSKTISGGGIGAGYGVAVDGSRNVFITGEYSGSANFGLTTLNSAGESDIFLAKLNSSGTCQWAVSAGGSSDDGARGIVLDNSGNIYICGGYTGSPVFGTIHPSTVPTTNYPSLFIAKYDSSGMAQWVSSATNAGFRNNDAFWSMQSLAIDSCNNLFITGDFRGRAQFGPLSVTSVFGDDIFVAKCKNNGQWDWVSSAGGPGNDHGMGITLDKNYDIYTTGGFEKTAQFGDWLVTASGLSDVYVAKYSNTSGDVQWVQKGGGIAADAGVGITLDNNGYGYVIGVSGNGTYGSHSISSTTACGSIFIAKLDTSVPLAIIVNPDTSYCSGAYTSLPFTTMGTFNSGNIFTAQISDANGFFNGSATQNIGSDTAIYGGTISISLPTTLSGNYRIRIVSSNPAWSSYSSSCAQLVHIGLPTGSPGIITALRDTLCQGTPAILAYSDSSGALQWQSSETLSGFTDIPGATNKKYKSNPLSKTTYFMILETIGGCKVSSLPFQEYVTPELTSYFNATFSKNVETFNSDSSSGAIRSWFWDFGDGSINSTARNPTHSYEDSGTYYVCLTLYDGSNCSYTFCRYVSIPLYMDLTPVSSYTRGISHTVPLYMNGNFHSGNTFTVQLSDVSHSFSSPTTISSPSITAETATSINILIPSTVATTSTYDIRVIASNPADTSLIHLISVNP